MAASQTRKTSHRNTLKWWLSATAVFFVVTSSVLLATRGDSVASLRPVTGVEVSAEHGAIDWDRVQRAGVSFVYLRATNGVNPDLRFERNRWHSHTAGIASGAVHAFDACHPARDQAEAFLRAAPPEPEVLAPAIDVSLVSCDRPVTQSPRGALEDVVTIVEEAWGRRPILHVAQVDLAEVGASLAAYPLWLRDASAWHGEQDEVQQFVWQFSSTGRVPGIRGAVDRSVLWDGRTIADLAVTMQWPEVAAGS